MSIGVYNVSARAGSVPTLSTLDDFLNPGRDGEVVGLLTAINAFVEASPIYAGIKMRHEVTGTRTRHSDEVISWGGGSYTFRTTITETYSGDISRTWDRIPLPVPPGRRYNPNLDYGNDVLGFGDSLFRLVQVPDKCYLTLGNSVGSNDPVAYDEDGNPILQIFGYRVDPHRPLMNALLDYYDSDGSRSAVIGTIVEAFAVISGTTPPGYVLPSPISTDVMASPYVYFFTKWQTPTPNVIGARVGPSAISFANIFANERSGNYFDIDVTGWSDAKWRDYRGDYPSDLNAWPLGDWDSCSVTAKSTLSFL